jgi:hypothetical protein
MVPFKVSELVGSVKGRKSAGLTSSVPPLPVGIDASLSPRMRMQEVETPAELPIVMPIDWPMTGLPVAVRDGIPSVPAHPVP